MADNAFELSAILDLDSTKFKKGLGDASQQAKGFAGSLDAAKAGSFALLGGLTAAAAGAVGFGALSVKAFADAEASQNRFRTAMLNVAHGTETQITALKKQQLALQMTTRFEDDAIASGQAFLATFQLNADQIEYITPRLLDMAEGLRDANGATIGLEQASNMLGKAIQLGSVGMLQKAGVTIPGVTKATQELWKKNFELANIQKRVLMIGQLVDGNFKGQAVSAGKTLAGSIDRLKNNFGNFMEAVGEGLKKYIEPLVSKLADLFSKFGDVDSVTKLLTDSWSKFAPWLTVVIGALIFGLIPALIALAASLWATYIPLLPWIAAGAILGFAVKLLIDHFGGLQQTLNALKPILDAFKLAFDFLWPSIRAVWNTIATELIPALVNLWNAISPVLLPVLSILAQVLGVVIVASLKVFLIWLQVAISWISMGINVIAALYGWVSGLIGPFVNTFAQILPTIINALKDVYNAITKPFREAFDWVKNQVASTVNKLKDLNPFMKHSPSLVELVSKGTTAITGLYGNMFDNINDMAGNFSANIKPAVAGGGQSNSVSTNIHGNINIGSEVQADNFLSRLSRNQELAGMGLATVGSNQ